MPPKRHRRVRFGPFTIDLISRELHGIDGKIRLQGLPFQILTILVEQPGEWVTREELRQRLWPADTFVDFDHSINTAIGKLRRALGDDSEEPRYIETMARHGYRLIAKVTADSPARISDPAKRKLESYVAPTAVLLAAALVAGWLYHPWHRSSALTEKDTVVLADIDNETGDEVFDPALKQALAVELGQSPFLNLLSDEKVSEALQMMGQPKDERITADVGREICERTGSKALLTGSISRIGSHYLLALNAVSCNTGEALAQEQGEAENKEDVLKTLSQASARLRAKLGESLPSVEKFNVTVEATTSSLEALKYFNVGVTMRRKDGDAAGIPFLRRAIELDPNFPLAYADLALSYDNLQQRSRALEYARKAYELRERTTKREQLHITALYFSATGELDKEIQTYELWTASYPRSAIPRANLGADYAMLGRYEKALPELQEAVRFAPDNVNVYTALGAVYLGMNRLGDAKTTFNLALTRKLDDGGLRQYMYYLAFLQQDTAKMEEDVAWAQGKPGDEDLLLSVQSDTEAYYGRIKKARELSRRAVDSAMRGDSKETAAIWKVASAVREAEIGDDQAFARQETAAALALSPGRDVKVQAALTLALIGDITRAKALAAELEKDYPTDLLLKVYWLPCINAAIEINKGNGARAITFLEATTPYEFAGGLTLFPAYLRGRAYLLERNGTAAAAEFQKLLDHQGIVQNAVAGSLAYLQIGRAYALQGDAIKAKAAFQTFSCLWKDADPGIVVLNQAKFEFAKLQ